MFLLPRVLAGTHSKRSIKTSWFWWANHEASNCLFEGRQLITIWDNDGCGAIDRISEPVLHDLWVSPKLEGPDHVLQVNCNCSWTRQEVSHHWLGYYRMRNYCTCLLHNQCDSHFQFRVKCAVKGWPSCFFTWQMFIQLKSTISSIKIH